MHSVTDPSNPVSHNQEPPPPWWRPTPTGRPRFHPSVRTAGELVDERVRRRRRRRTPPHAA